MALVHWNLGINPPVRDVIYGAELPCMIAPRISVKFKPGVYLLAALNNNVLAEDNPDTVEEEAVAHTDQHHFRFPHKERGDSEGAGRE